MLFITSQDYIVCDYDSPMKHKNIKNFMSNLRYYGVWSRGFSPHAIQYNT